jgi:hypothetical protein
VEVVPSDRVDEGVHDNEVNYTYTMHYLCDHPVEDLGDEDLAGALRGLRPTGHQR